MYSGTPCDAAQETRILRDDVMCPDLTQMGRTKILIRLLILMLIPIPIPERANMARRLGVYRVYRVYGSLTGLGVFQFGVQG